MAVSNKVFDDLTYVGTLVEIVSRDSDLCRSEVMDVIGKDKLRELYSLADVWHCLPMKQATAEFKDTYCKTLPTGKDRIWLTTLYKPVEDPRVAAKLVPRIVRAVATDVTAFDLWWDIYHSWMEHDLFNFEDAVYWQSSASYVACWQAGEWLY